MNLSEFINSWNTSCNPLQEFDDDNLLWLSDGYVENFKESYGVYDSEKHDRFRLSKLHYPLGFLLLDKLGYKNNSDIRSLRGKYHLMNGHMWESIILSLMYQYDVDIHRLQETVTFNGVEGHIDAVYGDNTVIDIKTMSAYYYKNFVEQPNDDRGYITQILTYREALGLKYAGIIGLNKQWGELCYIPINDDDYIIKNSEECLAIHCLERAAKVIELYQSAKDLDLEDIVHEYLTNIPVYQHPVTKRKLPPESLKYDDRKNLVWKLDRGGYITKSYNAEEMLINMENVYG